MDICFLGHDHTNRDKGLYFHSIIFFFFS
uniref:Uncharacterized protein n=1 Tax=Rhizophora mucronata TaxID=61149 RepID=A0A2P2PVH9_RHIMU